MDGSGEDTAEDNPQIGHRTELGTHDGTEDRTRTSDVQKLNHKNLPGGKHHEIDAIGLCHSRRHTVIWPEDAFHETSVEQITQHKSHKAH